MADKLIIFDTTLRDGEQSPGASMTKDEKLRIARQLERLKVVVIEAGFAASSNGDFEAVQAIANAIKDSTICSLSRANDRDISRAAEALRGANSARIHTFIATSALHMEKKLRMIPEQVLEQAKQSVRFARNGQARNGKRHPHLLRRLRAMAATCSALIHPRQTCRPTARAGRPSLLAPGHHRFLSRPVSRCRRRASSRP